ncbi:MAG TPA: carboxypeptidase regulatory-like domain-containing protein [Candidatus Didemnitutus sp.]|nr:carboxypeptidase regulatory-like domain-containing protein [Candidatus Didemnitutus sp.]
MPKAFVRLTLLAAMALSFLAIRPDALAQAIVSSAITGTVLDTTGAPVAGATVTAVHIPTNSSYTAISSPSGRFTFTGLRVGGPYSVSATATGFQIESLSGIQTTLGDNTELALVAKASKEEVVKLEKFEVNGGVNDLDSGATGASSVLSNRAMMDLPSVNRSFADLAKTNPFVSIRGYPQIQALGMNNRYNTITLDGAKINDSFGLNSSGLFSLVNPFSMDAIDQFSVSLTPYDVRQSGFAGAAINAVSKSGTNEFHGSVYDVFTDANWQGPDEFGSTIHKRSPLKQRVYGFTLGGPIWKDHLFFFINFEKFLQDTAPTFAGYTPDPAFLSSLQSAIATLPGAPNLGTWGGSATTREFDQKRLAKIDWNITKNQRLTVRYSDTNGVNPNFGYFSYTSFSQPVTPTNQPALTNLGTGLSSTEYNISVKEKVWAAQLFSDWTPDFKTEFDYSNTKQDSVRSLPVTFPSIRIFNVPGTAQNAAAISTLDAFQFGSETSSMGNELHVKTQTFTGSGDYTWRNFTFTGGADHEASNYLNLFRQGSYGYFSYWNLADFIADKPFGFDRSVVSTGTPTADISKFERTGIFGQIKWEPMPRLSITLGLRTDYIGSPIAPPANAQFASLFGVTNAGTIDGNTSVQPRLGFNYALDAKRLTQIRGGYGVFLGRNPWVWISNSYGNSGVGRFNVIVNTPSSNGAHPNTAAYTGPTLTQYLNGSYSNSDPAYKFDPANPIGTSDLPASVGAASINLIQPGLKMPTIGRGNLAIDRKIPALDAVLTVEYIHTDQIEALDLENLNLKPTTIGADGRQRFAGSPSTAANALHSQFASVIETYNTRAGRSDYGSISLNHEFKNNWAWNVAYTRGRATEASSLNSSTASSQFNFNDVFNQNTVEIARSDYEVKDRLQATVSRDFHWLHGMVSTVTLNYEGRSGQPYSWVYSGDLNGDGVTGNDLVAVPSGTSDPRFDFSGMTPAQQTAYFNYINQNGLSKFAGGYAPRNAFLGPWQNRLDMSFRQQLPVYKQFKVELFLDFLNFGSFLDKHLFNYVEEINTGTTFGGLSRVLANATYNANGQIKPTASTNPDGTLTIASGSLITVNNGDTRWRIQGGIHLTF